jgi:hypothetical protein
MKLNNRSGLYGASNVVFNPTTCEAHSYGWWKFVTRINGLVVFNGYNYSNSTVKHQYKVRRLLDTLGVRVDLEIEAPKGLQDLDSAISLYEQRIQALKAEINTPRTQAKKNAERRDAIRVCEEKIDAIRRLLDPVEESEICVVKAKSKADATMQAIHLLNPSDEELERAKDDAFSQGFPRIVIHTKRTWPKAKSA